MRWGMAVLALRFGQRAMASWAVVGQPRGRLHRASTSWRRTSTASMRVRGADAVGTVGIAPHMIGIHLRTHF
ncbi:hypothetical protein FHS96_004896 [Sphingomonas zeicaulis]